MKFYRWILSCLTLVSMVGCSTFASFTSNEATPSEDLTTIKVIGDGPNTMELFKMEEEEIAKQFKVKLEYSYPQRITENLEDFLFATNQDYDILILFPVKIPMYVEKDMIIPLDGYIKDEHEDDIITLYRKMFMKYDNHDYGMVYDGDSHLLFYRKDIFEKYSDEYKQEFGEELRPPNTWEEYDRIAQFLTRDLNHDGVVDIHGTATLNAEGMRYIWFNERFLSMGGTYFDDDMKPLIHTNIGIKALEDLVDLTHSNGVPPNSMYDWTDLNNAFLQGKIAMVVQWSDTARFSYDEVEWNSKVANLVDWAPVPGDIENQPRGGTWLGRVLTISKTSQHPNKAWEIIQHLTSKEVSKRAINSYETGNDPFRESHFVVDGKGPFASQQENKHFLTTVRESLKNTNTDLMIPGSWEYMQILDRNIGLALIKKLSPEDALEKTAQEWDVITNRYGKDSQKIYYHDWLQRTEQVREAQFKN